MRRAIAAVLLVLLFSWSFTCPTVARADDHDRDSDRDRDDHHDSGPKTATPIRHVVVIFDENNSFDHYFGTYPNALNLAGEVPFYADPDTPAINGFTQTLLLNNPNKVSATNSNAVNPFRLDPITQQTTCDNDNHYADEQQAFDGGLMDKFYITSVATSSTCAIANLAMGYYDGNAVTALWKYAQHYAMSDNFFDTEFGTTVMGHLNLISGETHGATTAGVTTPNTANLVANDSIIGNVDPEATNDMCPGTDKQHVTMPGKNVGDLLNTAGVTWGWFYGDFSSPCASYNPHYDPFQYYTSTANPKHLPPTSTPAIGTMADQANHQYDLNAFTAAIANGNLPAVSFLKASSNSTGHPSNSSPMAEQEFLVTTINQIMSSRFWKDTAILITWDDSDGWYDHVMPPIINPSNDPANDGLVLVKTSTGTAGSCGTPQPTAYPDRCGFGERLPFLVISPLARRNYVDHSLNDTTSILRFIEYNWSLGKIGDTDPQSFEALAKGSILGMFDFDQDHDHENRDLILNPTTGERMGRW